MAVTWYHRGRVPGVNHPSFRPISTWKAAAAIAVAAVGYGVAFATPWGAAGVLVAMPALFLLGRLPTPRRAFYGGLIAGAAVYGPHLWFFAHIFRWAAAPVWVIASLPLAAFTLILHLSVRRWGTTAALWLTPVLWTGVEYFRSELYFLRFAWLLPAQAMAFLPGVRLLSLGVYGVGLLYAVAASMLIAQFRLLRLAGVLATLALAVAMYWPPLARVDPSSDLHVAGVQLEFPGTDDVVDALDRLAVAHPEAQILVLSEYSFLGPVPAEVRAVVRRLHRYLVAGAEHPAAGDHYYDVTTVVGPDGTDVFEQAKSVPVQFMADGLPARQRRVWPSPWGPIGLAVCYDLSYANVMDDFVRQGARALIIPTMDVQTWGAYERRNLHGRMAPVRSAEYGIPTFGVWSSGVSQLTDRAGRVIATAGYPGQGDVIAGPLDLSHPGGVPPDRPFARASTIGTGGVIAWLLAGHLRSRRPRPARRSGPA
jgi:apolipoprotein N-acyltransferase